MTFTDSLRPVTAVVNGIDTAHRFLDGLFFDDMGD